MSETALRRAHLNIRPPEGRRRSLLGVGLGVAALLLVNGLVTQSHVGAASEQFVGAPPLPVVQAARPSAWRCPGPLPVGAGKQSSRIAIVNSAAYPVTVTVTVARARLGAGGISTASSATALRRKVLGDSQAVVELSRRGPAGFAAVSVESDRGGIGVSESILGRTSAVGKVLLSSPCTLGAASEAYVPAGSTAGSSDVLLSLFDPQASSAVVDVAVSNGTSVASPPAFQGLVVAPSGLVVLDLRRWVFQVSTLAVSATAVSGSVVVGAVESEASLVAVAPVRAGKHQVVHAHLIGSSLLVAPDRALRRWAFTALQSRVGVASTFSVYNPGNTAVTVAVAPPGRSGEVAALSASVPARGMVGFATPIAPGTRLGAASVVITAQGGAVVVARLTTRQRSDVLEELNATSGTDGPRSEWLLPAAMGGKGVDDVVTLANSGGRTASVTLRELTYGRGYEVDLGTVQVLAGSTRPVELGSLSRKDSGSRGDAGGFALEVSSTVPILVEQQLRPRQGQTTAVGGIPVEP